MHNFRVNQSFKNFILDALLPAEYERLQPKLKEVDLQQEVTLHHLREAITTVYFPTTCLLSWINTTDRGEVVEVGLTGNEGMAGVVLLLGETTPPWQTEVQLPGKAFKLASEDFLDVLERSPHLRQRVAAFAYLKMVQLNQSALCNRFHSVEERLCRWLLAAQDHTNSTRVSLTREILAQMIGAGRPAVSLATGLLQSAGLIRANRGEITILNREGMEDAACECYQIVRQALERYCCSRLS